MSVAIPRTYKYKVYDKDREFLGYLNNVTSDFSYSQDINTTALQTIIEVNASADVSSIPVEPIYDEVNDEVLDEQDNIVYEERAQDIVGAYNPDALIQENNIVEVYEYDESEPNGRLVFDGYIQEWKAYFNGGGANDRVEFTLVSRSIDLQDFVLSGGDTTIQTATTDSLNTDQQIYGVFAFQKLQFTSTTNVDKITLTVSNTSGSEDGNLAIGFYKGNPLNDSYTVISSSGIYTVGVGNTLQASGSSIIVPANSAKTKRTSTLSNRVTCFGGQDYYVVAYITSAKGGTLGDVKIWGGTSPGGVFKEYYYIEPSVNNVGYSPTLISSYAMALDIIQSGTNTTTTYSSLDPSAMLEQTIDNYVGQGGAVSYTGASIDNTGLTVSYTFVVATILEVIKRIKSFSPSDFYYYVNPATNVLYFKQTATTPHHRFIKGRHFEQFEISGTVENVVNELYFTGGLVGSTNLFKRYVNSDSITAQGRRRLQLRTDNRVTVTATADRIAESVLDQNPGIVYSSPITILTSTYDTSSINVGDIVKIEGFGNFIDYLLLQVARIRRTPDKVDLTLGVILKRQSDLLNEGLDDINSIQTIDNPTTPS